MICKDKPVAWRAKIGEPNHYLITTIEVEMEGWKRFGYVIEPLYIAIGAKVSG